MKQVIKEEYYGTLSTGSKGKINLSGELNSKELEKMIKEKKLIYGYSFGESIYIEKKDYLGIYPEEDCNSTGFYRLVKIEKVTTIIEKETIWKGL